MDELLTTFEVAEILRRPPATLRYWRSRGIGPACFRIGKLTMYERGAVDRWLETQRALTGVQGGAA
jgi:hypothetical protein